MSILNPRRFALVAVFCGLLLFAGSGLTAASDSAVQGSAEPEVTLLNDGIRLMWHLPPASVEDEVFEMAGFSANQIPGRPMLPSKSFGVALPPGAQPVLTVTKLIKGESVELATPIKLAPMPDGVVRNALGDVVGGDYSPAPADPGYTPEWATFEEIGTMAGVRLGRMTLHPILATGDLKVEVADEISVRLDFQVEVSGSRTAEAELVETDAHAAILEAVLNRSQIVVEPHLTSRSADSGNAADFPIAIIETDGTAGMIQVSYASLLGAGFPLADSDSNNFHLFRGDTEIAWRIIGIGADNSRLEAEESLVFYAPGEHSRWTNHEIFKLVAGDSPGRQMASGDASLDGLPNGSYRYKAVAEQDMVYTPQCLCGSQPLGRDGDRWMWQELKRPGAESADFEILTPNADSSESAELTVWLMGLTDLKNIVDDHLLSIQLNGTALGQVSWGGKTNKQASFTIPAGLLQENNSVTVTLEEADALFDGVWVDAFQIEYAAGSDPVPATEQQFLIGNSARSQYSVPIAQAFNLHFYDVTDPSNPKNLSGFSLSSKELIFGDEVDGQHAYQIVQNFAYQTPESVRADKSLLTENISGASYIILTPAAFAGEFDDLIELRSNQGYSVAVEEVERIYDQFGAGVPTPDAIQAFLKNAWTTWTPKPEMVLLVGDGHYDPRQNFDDSPVIQIPPFLIDTDPWMGETSADNRFVTFDGPDDQLPEMGIGRLPVNSVAELQVVLQKIQAYESADLGSWAGSMTVISDDTDESGNFADHSDKLIETYFPAPWLTHRYYLSQAAEDGSELLGPIKNSWNSGNGLVMFTGHSSIHQWAAERLFHIDEVPSLENDGQLPIVLGMSCFTSSFHYPEVDVMDENLLRQESGGAVATWGATGLGVSTGHDSLAGGFLNTVFNTEDKTLGAATVAGKLQLVIDQSTHVDLLDTFTLLGDPAMQVRLEQPAEQRFKIYLPIIRR